MPFHVFIEGSRDPSPTGKDRLARALGAKYGLSAPVVSQRLDQGSFCAWASVDAQTAQRLSQELDRIGAICTIREDGGPPAAASSATRASPPPPVPKRPEPPSPHSLLPQTPAGRSDDSALAGAGGADISLDLGALSTPTGADSASWSLSSLDGETDDAPTAVGPTRVDPMPAAQPGDDSVTDQRAAPVDPFAPPDMDAEPDLDLSETVRPSGTIAQQAPQATSPGAGAAPAVSSYREVAATGPSSLHTAPLLSRIRHSIEESARYRFAAGVIVAALIGLIPAQAFAWLKGSSAYDQIRTDLEGEYAAAETPTQWSTLTIARDEARGLVASKQQRIAVGGVLIWLLVAGAVAFVWFRVIDWDRGVPRIAPAHGSDLARRRLTR